ncbi:MAG TPA: hypothetical protein VFJ02_11555, partial [Vicinamibacterales bacterium]|nr:hypothetical protein [Vicinamibacterales bacterium]
DGWVTGFRARTTARGDGNDPSYHFIGVQVAQARAFADLEDGVPYESVNALYPRLIAANPRAVAAHVSTASFLDIGTPRDCLETSLALAETEGPALVGARSGIERSAKLIRTVVWDDVTVGPGSLLRDCVIGDRVRIPAGARFERCAIVPANGRTPQDDERVEGELLIRRFADQRLTTND